MKRAWLHGLAGCSSLAAAALVNGLADGRLAIAYALPVALAAALEGRRWAMGAAALCSAGLFAFAPPEAAPVKALEAAALFALAAVAGSGRRRTDPAPADFEGMKRAERLSAIGQLSAGLAHEIRNPLASISGAAAILARSQELDPKNARCLEIITGECQRLNGLLTNFLNFARPRQPRLQTVHLEPVLENVLALAGHGVRGKTVHFEKRVDPRLQPVECDPEQLEQVLLNLMINAIEASPDGGTVTLSAAAAEGRTAIRVMDHGNGVAPADIDRLFDPFFTTKEHGTGLGLPVAHQILRQMGGDLLAHPNAGRGMTFSVILPAKVQN